MARKSIGRKRIVMAKINKKSDLYVAFTKRRAGLFKKANELCTLTGAQVAILVNSPGKKVFSFGNPDVAPIIDRFLSEESTEAPEASDPMQQFVEAYRKENVRDLNMQLSQILHELEIEKKKGKEHRRMKELGNKQIRNWWESPVGELTWPQLEALKASLDELKRNVSVGKEIPNIFQASSLPPPLPPPIALPPPTELPPTYYASSSANVNGYFSQPLNFNVPYVENNFSGGMSVAGVNHTGFPSGNYMV